MSEQQRPPAETGPFIVAIVIGLFVGGTVLTFAAFLVGLAFAAALDAIMHNASMVAAVIVGFIIAAGVGVWGFVLVRKNVGFASGFVIGIAAGMLGGISICSGIAGGLNNMH